MASRADINRYILEAAKAFKVDPAILFKIGEVESGFKPGAKASKSTAGGLFQFINSTWSGVSRKYGPVVGMPAGTSKFDPKWNAMMGAAYIKENIELLTRVKGGSAPTSGEIYLAHFLGGGGSTKLIGLMGRDKSAAAALHFPEAAVSNASIFYNKDGQPRSIEWIYNWAHKKTSGSVSVPTGGSTTPGATTPGATTPGATTPGATTPGAKVAVVQKDQDKIPDFKIEPIPVAPPVFPQASSQTSELERFAQTYGVRRRGLMG